MLMREKIYFSYDGPKPISEILRQIIVGRAIVEDANIVKGSNVIEVEFHAGLREFVIKDLIGIPALTLMEELSRSWNFLILVTFPKIVYSRNIR